MCMLAALTGVYMMKLDNNIFTQVGLVVLIGLVSEKRDPHRGIRETA